MMSDENRASGGEGAVVTDAVKRRSDKKRARELEERVRYLENKVRRLRRALRHRKDDMRTLSDAMRRTEDDTEQELYMEAQEERRLFRQLCLGQKSMNEKVRKLKNEIADETEKRYAAAMEVQAATRKNARLEEKLSILTQQLSDRGIRPLV